MLIPVVVFMLAGICKPNEGVPNNFKHYQLATFFVALQLSTLVGGICQAAICQNGSILVGSVVLLVTVIQFFSIAGCVGHENGAKEFSDLLSKRVFLGVTTICSVALTLAVWDCGWSGSYNMLGFVLCVSLALLTSVPSCLSNRGDNYSHWTMRVATHLGAACTILGGVAFLTTGAAQYGCAGAGFGLSAICFSFILVQFCRGKGLCACGPSENGRRKLPFSWPFCK